MMYRVAARGSQLSLAQTSYVIRMLQQHTNVPFEIKKITTKGDISRDPIFKMGQRGIFEREVNVAVVEGQADFAVHSMKDVPGEISPELMIAAVPARGPPNDVIIYSKDRTSKDIDAGMTIGTSSLRRAAQARLVYRGVNVKPLRGNVDSRIKKVGQDYDAIILALAGIQRLDLAPVHKVLSVESFVPSPGQGTLAVMARADDTAILDLLAHIDHKPSRMCSEAERSFSGILESGCRFPVGAYAQTWGNYIRIIAAAYPDDGGMPISCRMSGTDPTDLGEMAGQAMVDAGADSLALKWRRGL